MANTVIALKKSATPSSVPSNLANGELAINYADGKLYYKAANGTIAAISGNEPNYFGTVNANNTLVVADTPGDVFTLASGNNIAITGDAINDKIIIGLTNDVSLPGTLTLGAVGGDEGGELKLANALTNSVLSGKVIIDIYQNKLRFYEESGTNRGAFIDLSAASGGVATDLLSSTGSVDSTARQWATGAFDKANNAYAQANAAYDAANNAVTDFSPAFIQANTARVHANAAFASANAGQATANAAFDKANTANITADLAFIHANAAFFKANNAVTDFSPAFIQANTARNQANNAYFAANNAFSKGFLVLTNTSTVLDGSTGNVWGGSFNSNLRDTYAGIYNPNTTTALFTFASGDSSVMSVQVDGSIFVGEGYTTDALGVIPSYGGWIVASSGIKSVNNIYAGVDLQATANVIVGSYAVFPDNTSQNTAYTTEVIHQANIARSHANAAFLQANAAYDAANNAVTDFSPAFIQANTARNHANAAFNAANNAVTDFSPAFNQANSAFAKANAALPNTSGVTFDGDLSISQNLTAVKVISTSNGEAENFKVGDDAWIGDFNVANTIKIKGQQNNQIAYISFGTSDSKALGRAGTGDLTYDNNIVWHQGNDGSGSGLDADLLDGQNSTYFAKNDDVVAAFATANEAFAKANTANITADIARNHANAAFANANTVMISAQAAFTVANSSFLHANAAYAFANSITITANLAFSHANAAFANGNTVIQTAQSAFTLANNAYLHANAAFASANAGQATANASYAFGNSAHSIANLAFAHANAAFLSSNSVNTYSDGTYLKLSAASQTITGNLSVVGTLTISGNTIFLDATRLQIDDPLIYLAGNNYTSDIVDIGFIANYVNATGQNVHTGLYREHEDKEYYLFQGYDKEPINNHIGALSNNMTLAVLNADLRTSNLILGGANAILTIGASFNHANAAHASANAAMAIGNGAFAAANAAFNRANTANITADRAWNHANAAFANANTIMISAQSAFTQANIAFANANTVMISAQAAFTVANSGFLHANSGYAFANSITLVANAAFLHANAAFANANTVMVSAQAAFTVANSSFLNANAAYAFGNSAHSIANLAFTHANNAYDKANIALSNTSGTVFNGQLFIPTLVAGSAATDFARLRVVSSGNITYIQSGTQIAGSGRPIHFTTFSSTDATMVIDIANTNVGIGRTDPVSKLDIVGTANASNLLVNGNMVFTHANDGSGSNLDADLLDGQHGTYYGIATDVTAANRVANAAFLHANAAFDKANTAGGGAAYFAGNNGDVGNATGLGDIFRIHTNTLTADVTIYSSNNALAVGPIAVASGKLLKIETDARLVLI